MTAAKTARSGPNIPEDQRGTIRVRIPRETYALANSMAQSAHISVAELLRVAVEELVRR